MPQYVPIDKVLHLLTQDGARPSIDLAARVPNTSRVEKTQSKVEPLRSVKFRKGLALSAVQKVRINKLTFKVYAYGSGREIGTITKMQNSKRTSAYSYQLSGDPKVHNNFPTQKAALERMLTKV